MRYFDPPLCIHSDNGNEFIAELIRLICEMYNVALINGNDYCPREQGLVEHFNKTMKDLMGNFLIFLFF